MVHARDVIIVKLTELIEINKQYKMYSIIYKKENYWYQDASENLHSCVC